MNEDYSTTPQSASIVKALWIVQKVILDTLDFNQVVQRIVDSLLTELGYLKLGYRIIVLTLYDEEKQILKRVSLSQTEEANKALMASPIPFSHIDIPISAENNLLIRTLKDEKPHVTTYWPDIFRPVLSDEEALNNQKASGIKTSLLFPVVVRNKAIGVLIFSMIKDAKEVTEDERSLMLGFTEVVGLAVQNSQLYTSLGDVTNKLKEANKQLQELDKLKDEFVSVASHELRTPLTAIRSYLWMALKGKGGALTEKQQYYLDRSYNSTIRLINLVNDMLNTSRIESGRMKFEIKKTNVEELIKTVIEEVIPRANELGITIKLNQINNEVSALMDKDKIHEVLINLIGNSLKFTPKGGIITVSCSEKEGRVTVDVTDTGSGLDPEDIPRLFQKFGMIEGSYATNQLAAQGTGLGLYICKSIIEKHQGTIGVASPGKNKGSTFSFTLFSYSAAKEHEFNQAVAEGGLDIIHSEFK